MREYQLRVVEAMDANACSLKSIDDFIEGRIHLLEEDRSTQGLVAWNESRRENRQQRVAELIEGERHLAGRVGANGRVHPHGEDEAVAKRNQFGLDVGACARAARQIRGLAPTHTGEQP